MCSVYPSLVDCFLLRPVWLGVDIRKYLEWLLRDESWGGRCALCSVYVTLVHALFFIEACVARSRH